jgi:ubiquinone/menaquinone biosynthesis C-methylase UbiE
MFVAAWVHPPFQRPNASVQLDALFAVDLAGNLLSKGSQRAAEQGLTNIEFRRGDLESLPFPDGTFDAVLCVFGIFFVSDVKGAVGELWRLVRPNGLLAITIWGRGLFEPADTIFWEAVRREDPELSETLLGQVASTIIDADVGNSRQFLQLECY